MNGDLVCGFSVNAIRRPQGFLLDGARRPHRPEEIAQVGEWLKPTDCKSVPPSEVRRFESFPVHHVELLSGREAERMRSWKSAGEIPRFFARDLKFV